MMMSPPDDHYSKPAEICKMEQGSRKVGWRSEKKRSSSVAAGVGIPRSSASAYKISPVKRFLKRVGAVVAKALHFMSSTRNKSSRKVSSASLARSRSYAETLDSQQRAQAVEDCIQFLNSSSSSLQRSNSLATSSNLD